MFAHVTQTLSVPRTQRQKCVRAPDAQYYFDIFHHETDLQPKKNGSANSVQ